MPTINYNQFCPVAKACEVIEPRWTLLILCEMWSGSTRFNEIKRGVPTMSPTLLSKRLKQMESKNLITRTTNDVNGYINYKVTKIGKELEPIVWSLGEWAHRNIDSEITLKNLDASLLMWNIRRKVNTALIRPTKTIIQFIFPELKSDLQNYWLISKPGCKVDLCFNDPGFDVDLYVKASLKSLTSAWIGLSSINSEISKQKIILIGDQELQSSINQWMIRSSFAGD